MVARNLLANTLGQLWLIVLSFVVLPLYLSFVGAEAYALIGFGLAIQAWAVLLDAGMSPILARDMARLRAGELSLEDVLPFLRSLDWIVCGVVVVAAVVGYGTRFWWTEWLRNKDLPDAVVASSMAVVVLFTAVRWAASLYRSGLMGLERQVFVNGVAAFTNAIRLVGAVPILLFFSNVSWLFAWWLAAALLELLIFRCALSKAVGGSWPIWGFSLDAFRGRARLTLSIALFSLAWLLVTQSDKLLLSRVLDLADYGYFTLAVFVSNAFLMLSVQVSQAFQPQFTMAASRSDSPALVALTDAVLELGVVFLVVPATVVFAFPARVLSGWTADPAAVAAASPYLGIYVLGTALIAPAGVAYMVQLAYGQVRLHVISNLLFIVALVPALIYAAEAYGAKGAAVVWLALNLCMLVFYLPLAIFRFFKTQRPRLAAGIAVPWLAGAAAVAVLRLALSDQPAGRFQDLLICAAAAVVAIAAAAAAAPATRAKASSIIGGWMRGTVA